MIGTAVDAISFIEQAQNSLSQLNGLELSGDAVESIKCYLTGQACADGTFTIRKLAIHDKHGLTRNAFNAKVNIHRRGATPILLGIEDRLLCDDERYAVTRAHVTRTSALIPSGVVDRHSDAYGNGSAVSPAALLRDNQGFPAATKRLVYRHSGERGISFSSGQQVLCFQ